MSRKGWNILISFLIIAVIVALFVFLPKGPDNWKQKYESYDLSVDVIGIGRENTYADYLAKHANAVSGDTEISVDVENYDSDGVVEKRPEGIYTEDGSSVTWKVEVPKAGMYNICMEYLTVDSRGVDVERELYINGELPFSGASTLCFSRLWTDASEVKVDNQGNQIRPSQTERFEKQTAFFRDDMGYTIEPYQFWFEEGENTLTLRAMNEKVIVCGLTLMPVQSRLTYAEYRTAQPEVSMSDEALNTCIEIQGESAYVRSSPSLYARYDRSSPATVPNDVYHTVLNYIGGEAWNIAGQWIEWEFEVPEDGYYYISIKARQMYQRGAMSCRTIYIDGEVPFAELGSVSFKYNTGWQMHTLADENKKPYEFYLKGGRHTIRMEVTMGEMGGILQEV